MKVGLTMDFKSDLAVSVEDTSLSQREFITLYVLHTLSKQDNYPKAIHEELQTIFNGKVHSYDYLCKISKQLVETSHLELYTIKGKNYYKITEKGKELFRWYKNNYYTRFSEVKLVINRFAHDLTGSGERPAVTHELPDEYRAYFSKIVSVKDLVRYVTLKKAMNRKSIYMGEIGELLSLRFGWIASNGYLYNLAHEMEVGGLLVGYWEGEKRTKRYLHITDEGEFHYKQIADSAAHHVQKIEKYLVNVLSLLEEK